MTCITSFYLYIDIVSTVVTDSFSQAHIDSERERIRLGTEGIIVSCFFPILIFYCLSLLVLFQYEQNKHTKYSVWLDGRSHALREEQ